MGYGIMVPTIYFLIPIVPEYCCVHPNPIIPTSIIDIDIDDTLRVEFKCSDTPTHTRIDPMQRNSLGSFRNLLTHTRQLIDDACLCNMQHA